MENEELGIHSHSEGFTGFSTIMNSQFPICHSALQLEYRCGRENGK
jgi:hypothetical protein